MIWAHSRALAEWFWQAASWVRSGERAEAVSGRLSQPPVLSGPDDHVAAFATWYYVLHQDIRKILDQVGPEPLLRIAPLVGDPLHAAG